MRVAKYYLLDFFQELGEEYNVSSRHSRRVNLSRPFSCTSFFYFSISDGHIRGFMSLLSSSSFLLFDIDNMYKLEQIFIYINQIYTPSI